MKQFKDFGIKPTIKAFAGDKIKIERLLNRQITVLDYKLETSKFEKGCGKCLYIQIELNGIKNVVFTGATALIDTIQQIPKEGFPFETIIKKENDYYEFT